VVFDLGGVLIDWDPRHLYRGLFDDHDRMEWFLAEVCNDAWNIEQDAGRPFAAAVEEAVARHPEWRPMIEAYRDRWHEMLAGAHDDTVAILETLHLQGTELHALTNWSSETFAVARRRFAFLGWFETITVSGEEGLVKPDLRIFYRLVRRIGHRPQDCVFIDDSAANTAAAHKVGFDAIHFTGAAALSAGLIERRVLIT
jgi:2-haloacid dehalogenase